MNNKTTIVSFFMILLKVQCRKKEYHNIVYHKMIKPNGFIKSREYVLKKIYESFQNVEESKRVEKSIVEYTKQKHSTNKGIEGLHWSDIRVRRTYCQKARSIIFNLKNIQKHNLNIDDVVTMTPYELNPCLWEPIFKKIHDREKLSLIMDNEHHHDGILQCERCYSYKTRYIELQTRSADESMTVYATCMNCSNNWTF